MSDDGIFGTLNTVEERIQRASAKTEGVKHRMRRAPLDPTPGQPLTLYLSTDGQAPYDRAWCYYTLDGSDPGEADRQPMHTTDIAWDELAWNYVRTWECVIPPQAPGTLLRYRLAAQRADTGGLVFADNQADALAQGQDFSLWIADDPVPAWSREAVIYQVFIDRFYPGDGVRWKRPANPSGFYGGTIRGVLEKLNYLQALGCSTLWLSPFLPSSSHHGYNATDMYGVEPRLGTMNDLHQLLVEAHGRGMRLLMDFVANHWSKDHPSFREAQAHPDSPYYNWYTWKHWPDDYVTYFGVKELPKLNLDRNGARDMMLDAARFWLAQGFDGFRLDFAYGPDYDFWVDFRRACRETKPDCWLFGEIIQPAEELRSYTGIMDGTLDFHLANALREAFALGTLPLSRFEAFLANHEAYFAGSSQPSFLDNHDMSRFLYLAQDHPVKLKLAALVQFTLAGPPIIYNGSESGTTQARPLHQGTRDVYEEARLPVKWGQEADADLLAYYQRLGNLRRSYPVLSYGTRRLVALDNAAGIYAYLRSSATSSVMAAVNIGTIAHTIKLPNEISRGHELLNSLPIKQDSGASVIELPPQCGAFIAQTYAV